MDNIEESYIVALVKSGKTYKEIAASGSKAISESEKEEIVGEFLKKTFRCQVCFNVTVLPAAACAECENILGCVACIEQWVESGGNPVCPLCRSNEPYETVPVLRQIQQVLEAAHDQPTVSMTSWTHKVDCLRFIPSSDIYMSVFSDFR